MLFDLKTGEQIKTMPHQREYDLWRQSISKAEYDKMLNFINVTAEAGGSIKQQDLITPEKWTGTPFEPVYMKACLMDNKLSRLFVEMILWFAMQNRPDEWYYENIAAENSSNAEKHYFRK